MSGVNVPPRASPRYADKDAYVPDDITAPIDDPIEVWKQFCAEAAITHHGELNAPPPEPEELVL